MNTKVTLNNRCPRCGSELPTNTPGGVCPACAFGEVLSSPPTKGDADQLCLEDIPLPRRKISYIGDYELFEVLGRGGMGVVYKAKQRSLNRIVALKMLKEGAEASEDFRRRFRHEAEAAAQLQHPNIVPIYEVGEHDGQPYFSMEFVAGTDLAKLVSEDGPLAPDQAARYLKTVAEAVQHAHERGVLHRDLKPSNILLGTDDRPHITDFGLAKQVGNHAALTLSGQTLGTPGYLPPEQASAKRGVVGPQSDVYSLGAVLYHLLTGRPPFLATTVTDTIQQVLESEPVPPRVLNPAVPRDLETICLKCLSKRPKNRYESADALAKDLTRWQRNEPILARPASALERGIKWYHREPVLAWSLTSIAAVILAGCGLVLWQRDQARKLAEHEAAQGEVALKERDKAERLNSFLSDSLREDLTRGGRADLLAGLSGQLLDYYAGFSNAPAFVARELGYARALLMQGAVHEHRNSLPRALEAYREAERRLSKSPRNEEIQLVLSRIHRRIADALVKQGETTNALKQVELALQCEPTDTTWRVNLEWRRARADALLTRATVMRQRGRYRESVATGREALAIAREIATDQPNNQGAQEDLVRTLCLQSSNLEQGLAYGEACAMLAEAQVACERASAAWPANPSWEVQSLDVQSQLSATALERPELKLLFPSLTNGPQAKLRSLLANEPGAVPADLDADRMQLVFAAHGAADLLRGRLRTGSSSSFDQSRLISLALTSVRGLEASTNKSAALKTLTDVKTLAESLAAQDPTNLKWKQFLVVAFWAIQFLEKSGSAAFALDRAQEISWQVFHEHSDLRWWQELYLVISMERFQGHSEVELAIQSSTLVAEWRDQFETAFKVAEEWCSGTLELNDNATSVLWHLVTLDKLLHADLHAEDESVIMSKDEVASYAKRCRKVTQNVLVVALKAGILDLRDGDDATKICAEILNGVPRTNSPAK